MATPNRLKGTFGVTQQWNKTPLQHQLRKRSKHNNYSMRKNLRISFAPTVDLWERSSPSSFSSGQVFRY